MKTLIKTIGILLITLGCVVEFLLPVMSMENIIPEIIREKGILFMTLGFIIYYFSDRMEPNKKKEKNTLIYITQLIGALIFAAGYLIKYPVLISKELIIADNIRVIGFVCMILGFMIYFFSKIIESRINKEVQK